MSTLLMFDGRRERKKLETMTEGRAKAKPCYGTVVIVIDY